MPTRKPPPPPPKHRNRELLVSISRGTVLLWLGIAGFIYEAFVRHGEPRPYILLVEVGMMGLPFANFADIIRRNGRDE